MSFLNADCLSILSLARGGLGAVATQTFRMQTVAGWKFHHWHCFQRFVEFRDWSCCRRLNWRDEDGSTNSWGRQRHTTFLHWPECGKLPWSTFEKILLAAGAASDIMRVGKTGASHKMSQMWISMNRFLHMLYNVFSSYKFHKRESAYSSNDWENPQGWLI